MEIFGGVGDAVMPVFLLFKSRLGSQIEVSMFKDSNNFGIYVDIHFCCTLGCWILARVGEPQPALPRVTMCGVYPAGSLLTVHRGQLAAVPRQRRPGHRGNPPLTVALDGMRMGPGWWRVGS